MLQNNDHHSEQRGFPAARPAHPGQALPFPSRPVPTRPDPVSGERTVIVPGTSRDTSSRSSGHAKVGAADQSAAPDNSTNHALAAAVKPARIHAEVTSR